LVEGKQLAVEFNRTHQAGWRVSWVTEILGSDEAMSQDSHRHEVPNFPSDLRHSRLPDLSNAHPFLIIDIGLRDCPNLKKINNIIFHVYEKLVL
jgi:hypothetical protein